MTDMSERRRFPRYPCKGAAELFQNGHLAEWGNISDIGRCGCYIEILSPMPVGSEVELRLSIAGIPLNIFAKVVCSTRLVGMGMEFLAVSQEQEQVIAQIIAEVTGVTAPPVLPGAKCQQPASATIQITREAAPAIFAKMLKHINENGVLTKEELVKMVTNP